MTRCGSYRDLSVSRIHRKIINHNAAETCCAACQFFKKERVVDNVVRSLILAEMRVIVGPAHSGFAVGILTGIVEICAPVFPAVCVKGSFCGHVCHTACRRRRNVLAVPFAAVLPVVAVGVIIGAVDVIQLACLTEIRGVNRNELAVKRKHIRAQTCYLRHIGMYNTSAVRRISAAKRKPACAIFINADARIERRRAILKPRHILINQRCAERVRPRTYRVGGGNNSHTAAAVREVQIEVRKTVFLNAGNDGRCP